MNKRTKKKMIVKEGILTKICRTRPKTVPAIAYLVVFLLSHNSVKLKSKEGMQFFSKVTIVCIEM
jgi:hypothetical protein